MSQSLDQPNISKEKESCTYVSLLYIKKGRSIIILFSLWWGLHTRLCYFKLILFIFYLEGMIIKAVVDGSETQLRAVIVTSMPTTYTCQFSKLSLSSYMTLSCFSLLSCVFYQIIL
jgi:hypothetical protein